MMKLSTVIAALFLAACGSSAPSTTPAPVAPAVSTAPTPTPRPRPRPRPVPAFEPVGAYVEGGDCTSGTPENPTCLRHLELEADGTGSYVGDDIIEDATWQRDGDHLIVTVSKRWSMTLRPESADAMVDEHGQRWTRTARR